MACKKKDCRKKGEIKERNTGTSQILIVLGINTGVIHY